MSIPLSELNKHFFADLLPATHGEKPQEPEHNPLMDTKPRKVKAKPEAPAEPAE